MLIKTDDNYMIDTDKIIYYNVEELDSNHFAVVGNSEDCNISIATYSTKEYATKALESIVATGEILNNGRIDNYQYWDAYNDEINKMNKDFKQDMKKDAIIFIIILVVVIIAIFIDFSILDNIYPTGLSNRVN